MKSVLYLGCPGPERPDNEKLLASANLSVVWVETVPHALSELQRRDAPVLLDLSRGAAALQSARDIRSARAATLMFAVVDVKRPDLTTEAVLAGMADVFARPLGGRRVANAIDREMTYELRGAGKSDRADHDLYSHSSSMREVMEIVSRAATMRAGVLIRGEEGTGRQVAARAIHHLQTDPPAPFIVVDCAAYDGDELEVALFGAATRHLDNSRGFEHVSRNSRLHDALGGTMYLQHIAEAPTRVQSRLARLLRDREAVLAETNKTVDFDVRPIAGVDPGFEDAVRDGRLRDELHRRLSVIRLDMPALRQRRDDIPALANYFLRELCGSLHIPPKTMSRSALALLSALPWRGNAAELRTLLESVVSGIQGGRNIGLEDVLAHVRLDGGAVVFPNGGTLKQARARFEREYIAAVLEHHRGRISDAAKALGIQRTNLYRKMRSLRVMRGRHG